MPKAVADPPSPPCYLLLSGAGIADLNSLVLISCRLARAARGHFVKVSSGNPRGRSARRRCPVDAAGQRIAAAHRLTSWCLHYSINACERH